VDFGVGEARGVEDAPIFQLLERPGVEQALRQGQAGWRGVARRLWRRGFGCRAGLVCRCSCGRMDASGRWRREVGGGACRGFLGGAGVDSG
jgi:hypothetical protein